MITNIEITNFKSFGNTVSIPIKPITLLFGVNSVGKSSIFQLLLMLEQSLNYNSLCPKGKKVDLGDFKRFIHNNDVKKQLTIKIDFEISCWDLDSIVQDDQEGQFIFSNYKTELTGKAKKFENSLSDFKECAAEITFCYQGNVYTEKISIYLGQCELPVITFNYGGYHWEKLEISTGHPYWKNYIDIFSNEIYRKMTAVADSIITGDQRKSNKYTEEFRNTISALYQNFKDTHDVNWQIDILLERISCYEDYSSEEIANYTQYLKDLRKVDNPLEKWMKFYLCSFDEDVVYGFDETMLPESLADKPLAKLLSTRFANDRYHEDELFHPASLFLLVSHYFKKELNALLHIGPLREAPRRYYSYEELNKVYPAYYLTHLPTKNKEIEKVNNELSLLNLAYHIDIAVLENPDFDIDPIYQIRLVDRKSGKTTALKDVGFGYSQILPVILKSSLQSGTFLIEQPELHLHPAMQAQIGDLFIRQRWAARKTFIIETHSEHLMLRVLRRIRQTSQKNKPEDLPPLKPEDVSVVYLKAGENGTEAIHIPITKDGDFECDWPEGFFDERERELFDDL